MPPSRHKQQHHPVRRRAVQDELVCAFDRVHRDHGVTARAFCAALALSERTFRSWQDRPAKPPPPPPPPKPPSPPPNDRNTGRFALEATALDTQLGGDTTDLCVLGVDLKLAGVQDIGDRERCLYNAFAIPACLRRRTSSPRSSARGPRSGRAPRRRRRATRSPHLRI